MSKLDLEARMTIKTLARQCLTRPAVDGAAGECMSGAHGARESGAGTLRSGIGRGWCCVHAQCGEIGRHSEQRMAGVWLIRSRGFGRFVRRTPVMTPRANRHGPTDTDGWIRADRGFILLFLLRPCLTKQENKMKATHYIAIATILLGSNQALAQDIVVNQGISEPEVLSAQQGWCKALVDISSSYEQEGQAAAKALAEQVIDSAYGYQMGAVLFKPTLTVNPQTFRTSRDGALAYFVGGDPAYPKDTGFALKGWKDCKIDNAAIFITGDSAATMGKVHFTDKDGKVTSVDKTWIFVKDDAGKLRIVLHHSSLEYAGN